MRDLKKRFKDVFSNKPGLTSVVKHQINTPPQVVDRTEGRNWPHHLKETINKEVEEMLKLGAIVPSFSPWRSYLIVVLKPDGTVRL